MMKTTKICKPVKKIPLTQGKSALVDERDYEYLMQWKWCYHNGYAVRNARRPGRGPGRGLIRMHRVILERMGFKDFEECDHINRVKYDNSRSNLRVATHRQNMGNCGKLCTNTSGYTGVCWHTQKRKWRAYIVVGDKQKHLGLFDDKEEAAQAYNTAARMYRGEFAVLNEVK